MAKGIFPGKICPFWRSGGNIPEQVGVLSVTEATFPSKSAL